MLSLRVYSSPTLDPTTSPTNSFHSTTYKKAKMLRVLLVCWFVGWLEQLKALIRNLCVTHWTKLNAKWNYELFIISHGFLWFSSKPISGIWQCPQVHRVGQNRNSLSTFAPNSRRFKSALSDIQLHSYKLLSLFYSLQFISDFLP